MPYLVTAILALGFLIMFSLWLLKRRIKVRQNLVRLNTGQGVYMLVSRDGGKNWREFQVTDDDQYKLVGPADQSHIDQMDAMAAFADDIAKNGSIDPTNPADRTRVELANKAGITFHHPDQTR